MTRICHMTSAHGEEDIRIFRKECVSLARNGYDVFLVERGDSRDKDGVHIVGVGDIPRELRKRMTEGAKAVYKVALKVDADIYHLHDPELLPYGMKLKRAGKKVIFDSHERYPEQIAIKPYLPGMVAKIVSRLYSSYENHVLKSIDGVIFPCTMCGGQDPFRGKYRKLAYINNTVILDEFFASHQTEGKKGEDMVCYVGGLTKSRGIVECVRASYAAGATLALAGKYAPESFGEMLRNMPEYDCVDEKGYLDRDGVRDLLQESKIGLVTLQNKGQYLKADNFGIKVYEYMAMGLPVILSHSPYNDRMVEKYQFGICVNAENTEEFSQAIRYLLDHPEEARRMGENGRRAVEKEFNWGVEEKKLLALYEDILRE